MTTESANIRSNDSSVINVTVNVNGVEAACLMNLNCAYQFSPIHVPIVTDVSPKNVSRSTIITLSGTSFGNDTTKLSVKVGSSNCNVTFVNDTKIECLLESLKVGRQPVAINLKGLFYEYFLILKVKYNCVVWL